MKWICFFFLLFFSFGSSAQFTLSGQLTGQGSILPQATVKISGQKTYLTTTNGKGYWEIKNLSSGTYTILFTYQGYQSRTIEHALISNENLQVELTPEVAWLQPVEVKALRAGDEAPFAKTNINKQFIERNNLGQDIPFLLNQTPNVVVNSDAGNGVGYTGIRIRGTDATRINMTINGIPYNDAESQGTFFVNLPDFLSSVSSIQVQRGVGTSSNGAGAFGATMNFSTHDYNPEAYAELNNSAGSFNTFKNTLKFGSGLLGEHFTMDVRLSQISSDGFVDRATSRLQAGYLSAGWWGKKSNLRLNIMLGKEKTYQAWYGIPASDLKANRTANYAGTERPGEPYDNETDNYWQNHYQLLYNAQLGNGIAFNNSFYLTTGKGYYEQYKADETLADYGLRPLGGGSGSEESDLVRRLWLQNKLFGQVFSLQQKAGKNEYTLGGGWSHYPGRHFGEVVWTEDQPDIQKTWYDFDAKKTDANLYAKWQHGFSQYFHVFSDIQYRFVDYKAEGFRNNPGVSADQQWHFINPKLGLHYKNGNWSGFTSYALGNKEPNRDDFEAGALSQPRSEQLHDLELNLTRKNLLPNLDLAATFYYMYYLNQLVLTGRVNDVGAYTRTNIPKSYRTGLELDAAYRFKKGHIKYSLAVSSNKLIDFTEYMDDYDNGGQVSIPHGNTAIAFSPGIVQFLSAMFTPVANFELEWMVKHVGRQFLDNTSQNSRRLDAYLINDVKVSYGFALGKWLKEARVVFQLNNLFNTEYEPNGYTFSYVAGGTVNTENFYYPMAGRNVMMALQLKF